MEKSIGKYILLLLGVAFFVTTAFLKDGEIEEIPRFTQSAGDLTGNSCVSCHKGIEPIKDMRSEMMQAILKVASHADIKGNDCVVCHGGNPASFNKEKSHSGTIAYFKKNKGPKTFYPDPGSPWINENTCGMCHEAQVGTQFTSLMFTEAGKIQGSLWGFGAMNGYKHDVGNFDVTAKKAHETLGTATYNKYMQQIEAKEGQVFPKSMIELPPAPTSDEVQENPQLAVYTYLRQECQRCHTGSKGREKRGDFRGMGCTSCHMPYSNEGLYEGKDPVINKKDPGHPLVHSIQSTRECKVTVHGKEYSGIPVETCTTCHDRGKRIGTSYQGLMETSYSSPFMGDGEGQEKLHTKNYLHLHADIHLDKGMVCQDCHTSLDVHSDGRLAGTTLAPVEIECQDCHGTPTKFPWELPLGYGDEIAMEVPAKGPARGLAKEVLPHSKQGTNYHPQDGFLLSARGNPLENVVKRGDKVLLHTAAGKDLELKPLKYLLDNNELSEEGKIAMVNIDKHIDQLECYSCHADWAPQCYGCHVKIDYSKGELHPDWLAMAKDHDSSGLTADARGEHDKYLIEGKVTEQRSYLRWENPPLVVNGEHRVSPAIPGCQTTITVIGKDGKPLLLNHIFKIPGVEGADSSGQLGIDVSPVQPHTTSKKSRACESCHTNPQAMGYGIGGGTIYANPSKGYVVDLQTADGQVLPDSHQVQINPIPNLEVDWSRIVTEDGKQTQTVGHHFSGSRPLNNDERANLDRRGVCASCHKVLPEENLAVSLLHHMKEIGGKKYDTEGHNDLLFKILSLAAWIQTLIILVIIGGFIYLLRRFKKQK
jgi:hypothetical protein